MTLLTKSRYVAGLQCPRLLWMKVHEKEKLPEPDTGTQSKFEEGDHVGELAKKLFPDGIDISIDNFGENLKDSKRLLGSGKPLFEAGFRSGNCYSRADILVPNGDKWDIVEVKSGTKVKDINLHDVSFQKYCYEGAGLEIGNCYLMHIDNTYVRKGELECEKLFVKEDVTEEVEKLMPGVAEKAKELLDVLNAFKYPSVKIGPQCRDPYDCPVAECWDFLPDNHIFHLYYGGKKCFDLFEEGIHFLIQEYSNLLKGMI